MNLIEVWREPDGQWSWRWLEPSEDTDGLVLWSNKHYESRAAAVRTAATAYPGVEVRERDVPPGAPGRRRGTGRLALAAGLVLLIVLRRRRRRSRPPRVPARRWGAIRSSRAKGDGLVRVRPDTLPQQPS